MANVYYIKLHRDTIYKQQKNNMFGKIFECGSAEYYCIYASFENLLENYICKLQEGMNMKQQFSGQQTKQPGIV